ncbi:MAG: ATP-binding protein [Prevotellaceae bacterium]|jgi:hypothetical protein|nr:ATP-binding protein [Prevotellaceae bacterium]
MDSIKNIPYGISDFKQIINKNYYFVDKTKYISLVEKSRPNLLFIRPRRFGKSLFLGVLSAYYDIMEKAHFDNLFGNSWIGNHPTEDRNSYQILRFDFSEVGGAASLEQLEANFNTYCGSIIDGFAEKYAEFYRSTFEERIKSEPTARGKLSILKDAARTREYPLYLIVDEYDNFTNIVLSEQGHDMFHKITHATGFYRDIFKIFKGMFYRIFLTGVSPVTLDDLTSGFNIDWNISTDPRFNAMMGFSEIDVREMFQYYKDAGALTGDVDVMIEEMRPWYDNYCFAKKALNEPRIFNCDMVLYYLSNRIDTGETPEQMLSKNARTDFGKLKMLVRIDKNLTLSGQRMSVIEEIAAREEITVDLQTSFPAEKITNIENYRSLLYYYGLLTISGVYRGQLKMRIPNNSVREQYFSFMLEYYQQQYAVDLSIISKLYGDMAYDGKWQPFFEFVGQAYMDNSAVRDAIEGERNVQGFLKAYLSLANYYLLMPELEMNYGFSDFVLLPNKTHYPDVAHSYLIEMKYAKAGATEAEMEVQRVAGRAQLLQYREDKIAQRLAEGTELHLLLLHFQTWKSTTCEEVFSSVRSLEKLRDVSAIPETNKI